MSATANTVKHTPDGWRPLDTAPHDGTAILLFSPDAADPQVMIGFWTDWDGDTEPGSWTDAWTMQEIDAWPTHWLPLPPAPQEKGGE